MSHSCCRCVKYMWLLCCADLVEFTDEEGYGRYLDLHDCYLKYINLKGTEVSAALLCSDVWLSPHTVSLCRNWTISPTCPPSTSSSTSPRTGRTPSTRGDFSSHKCLSTVWRLCFVVNMSFLSSKDGPFPEFSVYFVHFFHLFCKYYIT